MKILYFMNHADQGGAALALYDLIKEIKNNYLEIEPIVITGKKNKLNKMFDELGVENYSADFKNFTSSYHSPALLWKIIFASRYNLSKKKAIRQIEKYIDFSTISIIHTNLNRIDIGAILSKKYNIPHIWHIREHGDEDFKLISFKNNPYEYMQTFSSEYIAISKSVMNKWIDRGLSKEKMHLIYDGVRTDIYLKKEKKVNNIIKIIFLGGYTVNKGQEELIEAINLLEPEDRNMLKIDFYGNGSKRYIRFLKHKLDKYQLNKIVTLNNYDANIYKKLNIYDIGCTCSKAEGFGRVTVEYMLSGLCPIVSNTGANLEIVDDKISGIVYEKGNIQDLKEKIKYCINNIHTIEILWKEAQKKAYNNYSINIHTKNIISLYNNILKNNKEGQ